MTADTRAGWVAALVYAMFSVAWSWPLATDPLHLDVSRHWDGPGAVGLAHAFATAPQALSPETLSWPWGQSLVRGDAFVYFWLAWLFDARWPALSMSVCVLVGPVLSALGSERLARHLGALAPWSLLAGAVYGFSGQAATAVLEGYGFAALNPWLPWMTLAALRATSDEGTHRDAVVAALAWGLCLATTAYTGIGATLVLLAVVAGAWVRRRGVNRASVSMLAGVAVLGSLAVAFFLSAPAHGRRFTPDVATTTLMMQNGSATLGTLLWRMPSVDVALHSQGVLVSSLGLALSALGYGALRPVPVGVRRLLTCAALASIAAFGPALRLEVRDVGVPWVLAPFARLGAGAFYRFPERLFVPVSLVLGVVGACVLTRLAEGGARRWAGVLLVAAFAEAFLLVGLPFRVGHGVWGAPSAYEAAPRGAAVLDVWPRMLGRNAELEVRLSRRAVGYSAFHGRPVLSDGLNVSAAEDRRGPVSDWLVARAQDAALDEDTRSRLAALGVGAVALHEDTYPRAALPALRAGFDRLFGSAAARSVDLGETVAVWRVPVAGVATSRDDRIAAWMRIHGEVR